MGKKPNATTPAACPTGDNGQDIYEELACTNTSLRRAARRLGNLYDDALTPLGLKATQMGLLAHMDQFPASNGGLAPTLQDLAAGRAIQLSALTHALRPLVRDGLVKLQQDEQDRRTKRGTLTPFGKKRLDEAIVLWDAANRRVEDVLGKESASALRSLADYVSSDEFLASYNSKR